MPKIKHIATIAIVAFLVIAAVNNLTDPDSGIRKFLYGI